MNGDTLEDELIEKAREEREANPYQFRILVALNRLGKHIYSGSVSAEDKAGRRAKNKIARQSRRRNRK